MAKSKSVKNQINVLGETLYEHKAEGSPLSRDDYTRIALFDIFHIETDVDYLDLMDSIRESW